MKKFLLSTSAIVGVGLIAAPASAAEKITLGLGGYAESYIGFIDGEDDPQGAGNRETVNFGILTDKEIYFSGSTKLDNGISISVRIELEAMENQTTVDESYVSIESDTLGMIRIGGDDPANALANVSADKGISNDYDNWIAESNATTNDSTYDVGNAGDDQKLTYFSPRLAGLQLAASYIPVTGVRGGSSPSANNLNTGNHSAYALSLTFKETLADVGINSQIAMYREGLAGTSSTPGQQSFNAGLRLAYQGFDVGVAWVRAIKANGNTAGGRADGRTIQTSVSYKQGPWKAGVYHLNHENAGASTNVNNDETKVYTLFGEYSLSDGVLLQGMVFNVNYDEETNVDANEQSGGWGVVAGLKLSF